MEEEIIKLIRAREEGWGPGWASKSTVNSATIDNYFMEFSKRGPTDPAARVPRYEEFYTLLAKVNSIIDNADLTLCLTSKYEYVRERAKRRV
jgi:hypothetical protein